MYFDRYIFLTPMFNNTITLVIFRCDSEEQYYGAKYKVEKIDNSKIGK